MNTSGKDNEIDPCDAVEARVLGGARAADDPELAAHLGSCLRCFRAATELRDLPRLEGLLRAAPDAADPGEAFWQSFPARVTDAWVIASRPVAPVAAPSLGQRLAAWLRQPLPAACAGAACASVIVYLLVHRHAPALVEVRPPVAAEVVAALAAPPVAAGDDEASVDHDHDDDELGENFVHSLDATGLELLLEPGQPGATAAVEAMDTEDDGAPAGEELDLLDEAELTMLTGKLGRRI